MQKHPFESYRGKEKILVKSLYFPLHSGQIWSYSEPLLYKSIKAMKVKLGTTFKIIVIHILTINKTYKKLHFIRYLKEKKMTR